MILRIDNVSKRFGGIRAVDGCSFDVEEGSLVAIIGPNGSGKTTLFNLITGIYLSDSGHIYLKERDITRLKPHQISGMGIARTFQITRVFPKMTVLENMMVAPKGQRGEGLWLGLLRSSSVRIQEEKIRDRALDHLKYVGIERLSEEYAGNLSFGQQKLLEIARALMTEPKILLLDEPFSGVNPVMIEKLTSLIVDLNRRGSTILIVEHIMKIVMSLAQRIIVLNYGNKIAEGKPEEIQNNSDVIEAYLGV